MKLHSLLNDTIHTVKGLERNIKRPLPDRAVIQHVAEQHPLRLTSHYLRLIDWDDPDDPIRRIAIPSEQEKRKSGSFDTSGEALNTKLRGLQHKYRQTVLLLATNVCSVYCRHCFRKRLVGLAEDEVVTDWDKVTDYIRRHEEVTNVLLSGGDPLVLETALLQDILRRLAAIPHLRYVRIGTRVPVVLPERISGDPALLAAFREFLTCGKQLYITTQYNHPRELNPASLGAVDCLLRNKVLVNNQTVLLKGVNDDPAVLAELQAALASTGIIPYYVFQCRPVTAVKDGFQLPLRKACKIIDEARQQLDGLSKRFRFVMSHQTGKIEILGWKNSGIYGKYLQTNRPELHNRIFHKPLSKETGWLGKNWPEEDPSWT
uniref:KamA family radical SAM protein n=1 Tax=Candidatus Electronema sp. TaxID=2698783 RepID=UPI004055AE75